MVGSQLSPRVRRRLITLWVVFTVAAVLAVLSYRLFIAPEIDDPRLADAIVVFGGGGDRVERALELAADGYAEEVAISRPPDPDPRYCDRLSRTEGAEVFCFVPDPGTTQGEARATADLAAERGWQSVIVVVSTDQVSRARMLVDRCWDGVAWFVDVAHDDPAYERVAYEWGAMLKALVVNRGC